MKKDIEIGGYQPKGELLKEGYQPTGVTAQPKPPTGGSSVNQPKTSK